ACIVPANNKTTVDPLFVWRNTMEHSVPKNTYASYLQIKKLLSCQGVNPAGYHDELLFITIHQTHELWFKLAIHELNFAITSLMKDNVEQEDCILAFKVETSNYPRFFEMRGADVLWRR